MRKMRLSEAQRRDQDGREDGRRGRGVFLFVVVVVVVVVVAVL